MSATVGDPSFAGSPLAWSLLFARQPEPDLEFTEEELEQTTNIRSSSPMKPPPKKSGGRSLLWVFVLVLLGGGAYVAMEPELVTDLVGPLLGESSEPQTPPVAVRPQQPKPPAQSAPPSQPGPPAAVPAAPPSPAPQTSAPAPEPLSSMPSASVPAPTASAPPPAPTAAAQPIPVDTTPPPSASPAPLFGEGQRVTVLPNPAAPREKVSLTQDAAGTKPGPAIPPGTAFTILDGDLVDTGWVYYVRSDYGTKGWLDEKQLRLKP